MKKKNLYSTKIFFILISLLIFAVGIISPESDITILIIGALSTAALIILDIKIPSIVNLSEENPKIKTMRFVNRLTMCIIIAAMLFTNLFPVETILTERTNELLLVGLVSLFMMVFGNVSPKLPFNRYIGLRLPWTIRDEATWKVAHRVLGYISFPIAILQFILVFFLNSEKIIPISILVWVIIPSLYSLWFYYKKFKDIKAH